jgi:hypothetical protein
MSLSDTLFRLARLIAPDHRKPWIVAMAAEPARSADRMGWAVGAVLTALRERVTDLVATGALVRLAGGAFVLGTGLAALPFLARILTFIHDRHVEDPNSGNTAVSLVVICGLVAGMIGTGAAIMVAGKNRPARIAASTIVVLTATGLGCLLTWSGGLSLQSRDHLTPFQQEMTGWTLLAGPALVVAAAAMLLRRPRLFLASALIALGAQTGQWLVGLSHHAVTGVVPAAIAFYGACLPTLLLLAAAGLVVTPRHTA